MSDKTWARVARFAFWFLVWGAGTITLAVAFGLAGWRGGADWARDIFNVACGVLYARYILWHERFEL